MSKLWMDMHIFRYARTLVLQEACNRRYPHCVDIAVYQYAQFMDNPNINPYVLYHIHSAFFMFYCQNKSNIIHV